MTTAWLLPVLPAIVCAGSGGIIAGALTNAEHAKLTVVVSYVIWGCGIPPAMAVLIVYIHRLIECGLPPKEQMVSTVLLVGPFGFGSFGYALREVDLLYHTATDENRLLKLNRASLTLFFDVSISRCVLRSCL
jgi:tellurite resistance protein TehA-like permease